jgi:hypothetical protein
MKWIALFALLGTTACSSVQTTNSCLARFNEDKYKFDAQYRAKQMDDSAYMEALLDLMTDLDARQIQNVNAKKDGFNYCDVDWNAARWDIQESFDAIAAPKRIR